MAAKNIGMAILAVLEKLYGKSFINQIIGTRSNIIKPKELGILCGVPLDQCKTTEQKELDLKIKKVNNLPEIEGPFLL